MEVYQLTAFTCLIILCDNIVFQAGIAKEKLAIALEPEAASIFCQKLKADRIETGSDFSETVKSGMKYMVIDLGGKDIEYQSSCMYLLITQVSLDILPLLNTSF